MAFAFPRDDRSRSRRRLALYALVAAAFAATGFLLARTPQRITSEAHTLIEVTTFAIALFSGVLALVRYYSRNDDEYLLIGSGLVGTAFFDGFHLLVSGPFELETRATFRTLGPYSWLASRLFLGAVLLASVVVWRRRGRRAGALEAPKVYLLFAGAVLLNALFFASADLPPAYFDELVFPRPYDFLPAAIFGVTLAGYWSKGEWRRDFFEHGMMIALVLGVSSQIAMAFSNQLFDPLFALGHVGRMLVYLALMVGLLGNVYVTFRDVDSSRASTEAANLQLAAEIEVRSRAEAAARESGARLQEFLDHALDLIQTTTPDGRLVYVNESWKRTLEYPGETYRSLNFLDVVHPDDRQEIATRFSELLSGRDPGRIESSFVTSRGRRIRVSGTATAAFENGRATATRAIFRDVTDRVVAEEELRRQKVYLEGLFENAPEAIVILDQSNRIQRVNGEFTRMFGWSREEAVGEDLSRLIVPEELRQESMSLTRTIARGETIAMETVRRRKDGERVDVSVLGTPVVVGTEAIAVYGIYRDIGDRKRTERQLVEAKEQAEAASVAKSRFLATMSHELRTPLNSIIGFTRVLLRKPEARDEQERLYLERIAQNGRSLLELINDILDLSKVEAGRIELELSDFDLADLVRETVHQFEPQAREAGNELRVEVPDAPLAIHSDRTRLRQVLVNLIGNAVKFTTDGTVTVRVESEGGHPVAVHVIDTGIGIPDEKQESVFEAFQQADTTTTRAYGGTGLGLSISRSLSRLMGYSLRVQSRVGVGSTFTVDLRTRLERLGAGTAHQT